RSSVLPSFHRHESNVTSLPPADATMNVVAVAKIAKVAVYDQPSTAAAAKMQLANPTEDGVPLIFLVRAQQSDWYQVLRPVGPNGSIGWIEAAGVTTSRHQWRIIVQLKAHHIDVYNGRGEFLSAPIGVGRGPTPTPIGVFFTKELFQPPDPNSAYGAYAYGISG